MATIGLSGSVSETAISVENRKTFPPLMSSAVWIECTNVTDGRTDTGPQQRPRLRIASHGKNQMRGAIMRISL